MTVDEDLLRLVDGKEDGILAVAIRFFLGMLSKVYQLVIKGRRRLYDFGIKKEKVLQPRVISVGNITVGGTGKTPIVQLLARILLNNNYSVVVLNRGYKGEFTGKIGVVSDGGEILMEAKEAGDEAYMLASSLPEVPVLIGAKRRETGQYASLNYRPDFIILDDGFQHWQVARDYDLVVIDATNPFDNYHLLPRGRLREPFNSLKRAHAFFLTKADQVKECRLEEIKRELIKVNPAASILTTKHAPLYLRDLVQSKCEEINIKDKRVLAVSGIGNPQSFETTLEDLGAEVVDRVRFKDHHSYSKEEIMEIFTLASKNNIEMIITTEKDAVSIDDSLVAEIGHEKINFMVLGIEIELIDSEEKFVELISRLEVSRCK